jgi:signal transduction histidine kinase
VVALERANPVIIVGEPADEIAEAWYDFSSLAVVWLVLNAFILAILYVVLGRVLDPLAHLSKGMLNLEDGHYATRIELPKVKELAVITERFNMLAGALDSARDENSRLYRQLITVQEEERRAIANDGVTNAIRHGMAHTLTISLAEKPEARRIGGKRPRARLALSLSDDGTGIEPATPKGFGLTAMTERVVSRRTLRHRERAVEGNHYPRRDSRGACRRHRRADA